MTRDTTRSFLPPTLTDVDAWLFRVPDQLIDELPSASELEALPLEKLSFRDAERLFLCLLESEVELTYAKSYGLPGQAQEGIDVYGRLRPSNSVITQDAGDAAGSGPRPYVTLQSKRVKTLAASDLADAVTKFLEGPWAESSKTFFFATTVDFRDNKLDKAVRDAADRLAQVGVEFVPWDAERVNELLRSRPRLVDRFLGRHWVEPFCGAGALDLLLPTHLDAAETRRLRGELRTVYDAAFSAVASLSPNEQHRGDPFVLVDVTERNESAGDDWGAIGNPMLAADVLSSPEDTGGVSESQERTTPAHRRPRRTLRSVRALLEGHRGPAGVSGAAPADRWLAEGPRNLVIGDPGTGKSSLLRFIATDLLTDLPESAWLQRAHGDRLPVWLPFGFLCHHLDADHANSLPTAAEAWLKSHGRTDLVPLVLKALEDDRLLLLIDGIDEWTRESTANTALGAIETFLGHSEAAAVLTSRPYAITRLPFNLIWRRADVAPLDQDQQRRIATQYLVPPEDSWPEAEHTSATSDEAHPEPGNASPDARETTWSTTNVEPFLSQLNSAADLQPFARTPLLLALLARTWRGEPLPPRRYDLYNVIIRMLLDTHPKMRARASRAGSLPFSNTEFLTLIQAVAYKLKVAEIPQPVPSREMRKLIESVLTDDEILGYPAAEARTVAADAMAMAEDEFGVFVAQGAKHVAFVHRVIGDHLAGCHLAEHDPDDVQEAFATRYSDPAWTDVLLAALNAQPSKQTVAQIIDTVIENGTGSSERLWPADIRAHQAAWLFVADTLASGARLAPRKARELCGQIVDEVETASSLRYGADLISRLVHAAVAPAHWRDLLPTFKRWLDATRPYPGPALWALRNIPTDDEERIRRILLQAIRHEDSGARSNAVESFSTRFGNRGATTESGEPAVTGERGEGGVDEPGRRVAEPKPVDTAIIDLIARGPDARTQAAALLALALGWPDEPATREHLEWGRSTPKTNVRSVALHALAQANPDTRLQVLFTAGEYTFVMGHLYDESQFVEDHGWTGLNSALVKRAVTEATGTEKDAIAKFAEETLRQTPMTGGNREMCWQLACGPLADAANLRDWAIAELADTTDKHPLVLYNLGSIPAPWTDHPAMKEAINARIGDLLHNSWTTTETLARALPDDQARTALLNGLDAFRPSGLAHELVRRFGDDPKVREELDRRFEDDEQAARLAGIAIKHLGAGAGFDRIFNLLKTHNAANPEQPSEHHIVLAQAVAYGWHVLEEAAAGRPDPEYRVDQDAAADVIACHNARAVAAACMAVPTRRGLSWHISDIILTWPAHTAQYSINELRNDTHVSEGLPDRIHAAALIAHANQAAQGSRESKEVVDLALGLLTPLPPELREVLVHELSQVPISPTQLLDALAHWTTDQDDGVRRTSAIGITRALQRSPIDPTTITLLREWRDTVRGKLVAYGHNYEEERQIAWTCMLLLGDPELLDGLMETIGDPTPPGVRLTDVYGNADDVLVDLVAGQWLHLLPHLGESPLVRLTATRPKPDADEARALRALISASDSPAVAALVQQRIVQEKSASGTSRTEDMLHSTPAGVDHLIALEGRTVENYRRVLGAADHDVDSYGDREAHRERWAFTRLTEHWDITDAERASLLLDVADTDNEYPTHPRQRGQAVSIARAAHVFLFPTSEAAQRRLADFEEWFRQPGEERRHDSTTWLEGITLSVMATPPEHLPLILERLFYPHRVERAREPIWKFTTPLMHRLAIDAHAVTALNNVLDGTPPAATSPLLPFEAPFGGPAEHYAARRTFLAARVLKAAGHLTAERLQTALEVLRAADSRLTVFDPFTDTFGPLHTLGADL